MDWWVHHCVFFLIWKVSFFEGCDVVDMWSMVFCFCFFFPTSRVEEWEFGKIAEMIIMWGNQNEWCVEFANACVMGNLHFILNNILTNFFKELTKHKNDHQWYLNYIYRNYIMHLIVYL